MVPFVSRLSKFDSMRTSRVKPGLFTFSIRESMRSDKTGNGNKIVRL